MRALIQHWFGARAAVLPEAHAARLAAWRSTPRTPTNTALDATRLVVVDVETSGLDLARDRLIAIGAVAVCGGRVMLDDTLDVVLRQDAASSKDNILIHGIGGQAQCQGVPPAQALLDFLEYLGGSPLVAFHAAFDRGMLTRALREHLGVSLDRDWADLALLAPALHPTLGHRLRHLDGWLAHFGITNFARHNALADAVASAELLLALRGALTRRGDPGLRALFDLAPVR